MSSAARQLDPERFELCPGIVIFDEHEEDEIGKDGKKTGKKRIFDRAMLTKIAARCNARVSKRNDMSPITLGHTIKGAPEKDQPPIVGLVGNFQVARFGPEKTLGVVADFYMRRDRGGAKLLEEYPRRSVELWDDGPESEWFFDPIAILKRTPMRDLGLTLYERPTHGRTRYAREYAMADLENTAVPTKDPLTSAGVADDAAANMDADHEAYMKHCYGHPMAAKYYSSMCKKYGMPNEPVDGTPASIDNPPPPTDATAYARGGASGNTEGIHYQRLLAAIDGVKKELAQVKVESARRAEESQHYKKQLDETDVQGRLELLARDGFEFDPEKEMKRMLPMTKEQRDDHIQYARQVFRNREEPSGAYAVPTAREPLVSGDRDDGWKEEAPGVPGRKHAEAALQYQKTSAGRSLSWDQCLEKTKRGSTNTNGVAANTTK
jgi:hypothetical protein